MKKFTFLLKPIPPTASRKTVIFAESEEEAKKALTQEEKNRITKIIIE